MMKFLWGFLVAPISLASFILTSNSAWAIGAKKNFEKAAADFEASSTPTQPDELVGGYVGQCVFKRDQKWPSSEENYYDSKGNLFFGYFTYEDAKDLLFPLNDSWKGVTNDPRSLLAWKNAQHSFINLLPDDSLSYSIDSVLKVDAGIIGQSYVTQIIYGAAGKPEARHTAEYRLQKNGKLIAKVFSEKRSVNYLSYCTYKKVAPRDLVPAEYRSPMEAVAPYIPNSPCLDLNGNYELARIGTYVDVEPIGEDPPFLFQFRTYVANGRAHYEMIDPFYGYTDYTIWKYVQDAGDNYGAACKSDGTVLSLVGSPPLPFPWTVKISLVQGSSRLLRVESYGWASIMCGSYLLRKLR